MTLEGDEVDLWPQLPRFRPIPSEFHSLELDGPFAQCMLCQGDLADANRKYSIERVFRGSEPIVEYAMCLNCQQGMCSELSAESQQKIQAFFRTVDHDTRIERLRARLNDDSIGPWIDECLVTGKNRADCRGHQIIAYCQGGELLLSIAPFMLADDAVEELMKVVSKQTRDRMEDFLSDNFGMPPEFCQQPDFFPVLM